MNTLEPDGIYHRQMSLLAAALQGQNLEVVGGIIQVMLATFEEDGSVSPAIKKMKQDCDDGDLHAVMETVIVFIEIINEEKERNLNNSSSDSPVAEFQGEPH